MQLDEITPYPVYSVLSQGWKAEIPGCIVGGAVLLPAVILQWPYLWLFIVVAVLAAGATDFLMSNLRRRWRAQEAMTPPQVLPEPPVTEVVSRARRWAEILGVDQIRSFVLFSYGTCIVSVDEVADPVADAKNLLKEFGHAIPGTPSADMFVYTLPDTGDFVVGGQHPYILTFVPRDMFGAEAAADELCTAAAFCGRDLRVLDTFALDAVHTHRIGGPEA